MWDLIEIVVLLKFRDCRRTVAERVFAKKKNIFNLEKNKIDQASGYFNNIIIGFRYTYFGNQLVYEQQKKLSKCLFSPLDLMTYEKKSHDNIIFNWHNRIGFCTVKGWVQFYDREASCSYFRFLLEFVLLELLFFYFVLLFSVFKYFCEFHTTACYLHVPHILEIVCCSWRSHHYTIVVQNTIVFLAIWFWNGRFFQCMIEVLNLFVFLNYQMWTYPLDNQVPIH